MADRRSFLKTSTAAAFSATVAGCAPGETPDSDGGSSRLNPDVLAAVAETVLPASLSQDGRIAATSAFVAWCESYEPAAELNHGYGTSELRYLPEDPSARWAAQLDALDRESQQRYETAFADLDAERRAALLAARLDQEGSGLGRPYAAGHVAAGLLAHWAASTAATDLCYDAPIGKLTCRGLDGLRAGQGGTVEAGGEG